MGMGWAREAGWLLPLRSVWDSLPLLSFAPLGWYVEKAADSGVAQPCFECHPCYDPEYVSYPH